MLALLLGSLASLEAPPATAATSSLFRWGSTDVNGLPGSPVPVPFGDLGRIVQLSASGGTRLALDADGQVFGWGDDSYGQVSATGPMLGGFNSRVVSTPTKIAGLVGVKQVVAGGVFSAALLENGDVVTWGAGPLSPDTTPGLTKVNGFPRIEEIGASQLSLYARDAAGNMYVVGWNFPRVSGPGTTNTPILALTNVRSLGHTGGRFEMFAVRTDGTVLGWGGDTLKMGNPVPAGQLQIEAKPVSGVTGARSVVGGQEQRFAVLEDGSVVGWGTNQYGQLGTGDTVSRATAVPVRCIRLFAT